MLPAESTATRAIEFLGWSRDGSKALIRATPGANDQSDEVYPEPDLVLMDARSGRVIERMPGLPHDCSWDEVRRNPSQLERLLRLVAMTPVPGEWLGTHGLVALADHDKRTLKVRSLSIVTGDTVLMTLKGRRVEGDARNLWAERSPDEVSVNRSPDGRRAAVFAGDKCGPTHLPVFVGAEQLRRIEAAATPIDARTWTPPPFVPVHRVDERAVSGSGIAAGWSLDGTKAVLAFGPDESEPSYLQLRDVRTGRAIETLDLGTMDSDTSWGEKSFCDWETARRDPDGVRAILRLARFARGPTECEGESLTHLTCPSPDGKRLAAFKDGAFVEFAPALASP
jgi:hypothetical protein